MLQLQDNRHSGTCPMTISKDVHAQDSGSNSAVHIGKGDLAARFAPGNPRDP